MTEHFELSENLNKENQERERDYAKILGYILNHKYFIDYKLCVRKFLLRIIDNQIFIQINIVILILFLFL